MFNNVKRIQGCIVILKFHKASSFQIKEMSCQIFRLLKDTDLSLSGNILISKLLSLNLNADYLLYKKPAKRIIHIYCK